MEEVRQTALQYRAHLNQDQVQAVQQYLHRTTLFWNFMLSQLRTRLDAYIDSDPSEVADKDFLFEAQEVFDMAVGKRALSAETESNWGRHLRLVQELPESVLVNRFSDLINAFSQAKRERIENIGKVPDLPRRKNRVSSHSVRFGSDMFTITSDGVVIDAPWPLKLDFPANTVVNPSKTYQLSITMRRIKSELEQYGPMDHADREYSITLREAA